MMQKSSILCQCLWLAFLTQDIKQSKHSCVSAWCGVSEESSAADVAGRCLSHLVSIWLRPIVKTSGWFLGRNSEEQCLLTFESKCACVSSRSIAVNNVAGIGLRKRELNNQQGEVLWGLKQLGHKDWLDGVRYGSTVIDKSQQAGFSFHFTSVCTG